MTAWYDCRQCPEPRQCSGHTYSVDNQSVAWYTWGEIRFCQHQMYFLLKNLPILEIGRYPPDPRGSSYVDPQLRSQRSSSHATFEKPVELAAEVKKRLDRTGIEGRLLRTEIEAGYDMNTFSRESRDALRYISGWRRRRMLYGEWKRTRRWRGKMSTETYTKERGQD